jgi:rubrerythrin
MLSRFFGSSRRSFASLSEQEILALAISSEEDDARIYLAYADGLREEFPQSAQIFEQMAKEEHGHRDSLIEQHRRRFGEHIPLIRREHVSGYYDRKPDWLVRPLGIEKVRETAAQMEEQAYRFYIEENYWETWRKTRKNTNTVPLSSNPS